MAGLLHDVGKIGVPVVGGATDPEEFDLIKKHPDIGEMRILATPPPACSITTNGIGKAIQAACPANRSRRLGALFARPIDGDHVEPNVSRRCRRWRCSR